MANDFLTRIIAHKQEEVTAARRIVPEERLREQAASRSDRRSFIGALGRTGADGIHIIAEIKRASPSKGIIRADLDPRAYAVAYEQGGATALSVLTDQHFFRGAPQDLKQARAAVSLPVLRKDFIVSAYQVYETAAWGADAILLIVRTLSGTQLREYLQLAGEVGLDALVEVHTTQELEHASQAGARLIGINNRNLASFETNINIARDLAARVTPEQIPVAASGIHSTRDIEKNLQVGIRNFLIGESLVRASHPQAFLRQLCNAQGES